MTRTTATSIAIGLGALLLSLCATAQPRMRRAEQLVRMAIGYAQAGSHLEAARAFLEAYELSDDPELILKAGLSFESGRQPAAAVNTYLAFLQTAPADGRVRRQAIAGLKRLKRFANQTHGEVVVESVPSGAEVTVLSDGRRLGRTPLTVYLPHGAVRVRVAFQRHEPVTATIEVRGDQTATFTARLLLSGARASATLVLLGVEGGSTLTVDGEPVLTGAATRKSLTVSGGDHIVRLIRPSGLHKDWKVTVPPGGAVTLDLSPSRAPPASPVEPRTAASEPEALTPAGRSERIAGWTLLGVGLCAVGAGVALGVLSDHDLETGMGIGAIAAYASGGAAILTSTILFAVAPTPGDGGLAVFQARF